MLDYRDSHTAPDKGTTYHRKFSENPYRSMIWEYERALLADVVDRWLPRPGTHLDFACGTGRILGALQGKMREQVGVDVSESMLSVARETLSGEVQLINADLTRENVMPGRKFDLITAFRFFPNAQDELRQEAMLALAGRLESEGILVFNNHKNSWSPLYTLARLFRQGQRDFSPREVEALIENCNLQIVERHHIALVPATEKVSILPMWLLRPLEHAVAKVPFLGRFSANQIYVVRLRSV